MNFIFLIPGASAAVLQYLQPLDSLWIGHDKWASDNLVLAACLGAAIGTMLHFAQASLSKTWKLLVLSLVGVGFLGGLCISIYWSISLASIVSHSDQAFFRDAVWKMAHLSWTMSLTILLFCVSFFRRI